MAAAQFADLVCGISDTRRLIVKTRTLWAISQVKSNGRSVVVSSGASSWCSLRSWRLSAEAACLGRAAVVDGDLSTHLQGRRETELSGHEVEDRRRRTVAVFWDLDNKPPNSVPPYDAALRLKNLASELGEVVDMVAYANRNAFTHVPARVREEREDRRLLDQLERRGIVKVEQPYICSMCGRKCKTNLALKKHFKQLHERERQKRMNYLGTLKGKKREKFLQKVSGSELRYKEAARSVIVPKVGYGLSTELKRAGVHVRTVESRPQAADEALIKHMNLYINRGLECLVLVSDDSDFLEILSYARSRRLFTVVVGDTHRLRKEADTSFLWEDVASGRARLTARDTFRRWGVEDSLRAELLDQHDEEEEEEEEIYFSESEGGYSDDDEGLDFYRDDEEDEENDPESFGQGDIGDFSSVPKELV